MSAAAALLETLAVRGLTLVTAESLTGGLLASSIVEVPGASRVYRGGVVAYDERVKASALGVSESLLRAHGAVHPEVARQMALGARTLLTADGASADIAVSTTGIAGPRSPDGQPVGTVHIAVSMGDEVRQRAYVFNGDRWAIRRSSVAAALEAIAAAL